MPALIERPKMTKAMYQALKRHIIKEREKKKQELEQDAQIERQKKEQEQRRRKEQEDSLTLEQTKEQVQTMDKKLDTLKQEKHELFSQLKKVLHQEDETRKRAQLKEQSELLSLQQAYPHPANLTTNHAMLMQHGRPALYRPTQPAMMHQMSLKRPRSPSPPPSTVYQPYPEPKMMATAVAKQHPGFSHPAQTDYKSGNFPQGQPTQVSYANQQSASHAYQQAAAAPSYTSSKSPASKYSGSSSQSAFTAYPNHYATHQQPKQMAPEAYQGYPVQRMQQPGGYMAPGHGSAIPLQQQLEHANQKAGFNEEKYKMQQSQIRGVAPLSGQQAGLVHQQIQLQQQQQQSSKGSIITGYSARGQAPPTTTTYKATSNPANFPTQGTPGRPSLQGQHPNRYY